MTIILDGTAGITTPAETTTGNESVGGNLSVTGTVSVGGSTMYPLVSGTAVASTSGTSLDFLSIPAWVKRITVMFQGVSTSGTSTVQIQLGSGSFTTSGYTGAVNNGAGTNTNNSTGFQINTSVAAADLTYGAAVISNITGNIWTCNGTMVNGNVRSFSGSLSLAGVLDRVRITTVNGTDTFDAGTVNLLWE
jgi:hypothetical protein